ncbi:hypothetical protein [Motilimonas eburnea]|uniref:hypothetical protein n=1 Tax=Motilimonas eburnea TaxID=1737488 RepID=UPI001E39BF5A|nr:hypothetical protein [Motilimonas eburnea]MCE2570053.1 hypothetical protein [Motilimonas eburnea]
MKTITVPKNTEAERLLDLDQCPPEQLEEIILSKEQFANLWSAGFFDDINKLCGSMIDDYEDEILPAKNSVPVVLAYIQTQQWEPKVHDIVNEIKYLLIKAKEYGTSVHFYF